MWLLLILTGSLVDLALSYTCGDGRCTCYPNMDLIDCRNQFLKRFPDDFTVNDKTYTQYINLQDNEISRMELNLVDWKSLRLINLMNNPVNCEWLDRQDWKILVKTSCKLTVDTTWERDWLPKDEQKNPKGNGRGDNDPFDDFYEDDDDDDDYYYTDDYDGYTNGKKVRKASRRYGGPPSAGTVAAAVIVTIVGLVVIVVGVLYYMKRSREAGQRRRLDNIMTATDEE